MIDWSAFLLVAIVSVVAACSVVAVYSTGLRLWSTADTMAGKYSVGEDGKIGPSSEIRRLALRSPRIVRTVRSLAVFCFVVTGAAILYGIYLIIPAFHH